jgi:hypothetical protein
MYLFNFCEKVCMPSACLTSAEQAHTFSPAFQTSVVPQVGIMAEQHAMIPSNPPKQINLTVGAQTARVPPWASAVEA